MAERTDAGSEGVGGQLMRGARKLDELIGIASALVSAGTAVVSFIKGVGGLTQFLVEVAFYGFASYIAMFLVLPVVLAAVAGLEKATRRTSTKATTVVIVALGGLGGGALVRFGLFADDVTRDLDGIGTAFGVICGIVILLVPLAILWYVKGSKPAGRPSA
jgi:hypothetical protein